MNQHLLFTPGPVNVAQNVREAICKQDICKDEKGNPKGTLLKGAIAKEACDRWPGISKLAKIVV